MKTKTKKKSKYKRNTIILVLIIIILFITNIIFIYNNRNINKEERIIEEVLFTPTKEEYNQEKKYYANIKYKKFKSLYKSDNISTIAIVDTSSNTYDRFIELINKIAYYKSTKIYTLQINKLSRKDEIAFLDLDGRLSKLDSNYIITISNNKIISLTTFDNENINKIIKGLGE